MQTPLLRALVAALVVVGGACEVPRTNPFDPEAPLDVQARATLNVTAVDLSASEGADAAVPLEGVRIEVVLSDGSKETADSDDEGHASLRELLPGHVQVRAERALFLPVVLPDVALAPGELRELTLPMVRRPVDETSGFVAGTVQRQASLDHGDIEVSAQLAGDEQGEIVGRTYSTPTGAFSLGLPPGSYDLTFSARGYEEQRSEAPLEVTEGSVQALSAPVVLPFIPGTVSGRVAVEDATVVTNITLSLDGGGDANANADGTYTIAPVPPGTYLLTAFADGHAAVTMGPYVVLPDQDTPAAPIFLPRARGDVAGVVRLPAGLGDHSGILVQVSGTGHGAFTDEAGAFVIEDVPTGTYTLSASKQGFLPGQIFNVQVSEAQTADAGLLTLAKQQGDVTINGGALYTRELDVTLDLDAPDSAVEMRIGEAPFAPDDPWVPFAAAPTVTLSTGDGPKTLYVQIKLVDGTEGQVLQGGIVLDQTPPQNVALLLNGGAAFATDAAALLNVRITASDATSGPATVVAAEDMAFATGTVASGPYGTDLVLQASDAATDGLRTVYARVTDAAGNASDVVTTTITLDRTPPVVSGLSVDCGGVVGAASCNQLGVTLTFDAGDAVEWAANTDGAPPAEGDWQALSPMLVPSAQLTAVDGLQTVFVFARDAAGNVSDGAFDTIELDTSPPSAPVVVLANGLPITNDITSVPLTLFAQDAVEMVISVDADVTDDPRVAYSTVATVDLPNVEGTATVFVAFFDAAGNQAGPVTDSIVVDLTPPAALPGSVAINGGAAFTSSVSVTVSVDSDADLMQVATDGVPDTEPWAPYASSTIALLPAGDCPGPDCKQVCVSLRDIAGNVAGPVCDAITLDTAAPAVPILTSAGGTTSSASYSLTLAEQPADAFFARYELLVAPGGDGSFQTITPTSTTPPTFDLTLASSGQVGVPASDAQPNLLRIRAVDQAGNVGAEASVSLVLDQTPPAMPELLTAGSPVVNADSYSLLFSQANPADDDATFAGYEIAKTLGGVVPQESDFTPTSQLDGIVFSLTAGDGSQCVGAVPCENNLWVRAVDAAGNRSAAASLAVLEDSTAPSKPKVAPRSTLAGNVEIPPTVTAAEVFVVLSQPSLDGVAEVPTYEVSGGALPDTLTLSSPVSSVAVPLVRDASNDICVRGLDAAGNASTEDCVSVRQLTISSLYSAQEQDEADIWGDYVVSVADREDVQLYNLVTGTSVLFQQVSYLDPADSVVDVRVKGDANSYYVLAVHRSFGGSPNLDGVRIWPFHFNAFGGPLTNVMDLERFPTAPFIPWSNAPVGYESRADFDPISGAAVAYIGFAPGEARIETVSDFITPSAPVPLTGAITLCGQTRPVIAGDVVAWCEDLGNGEARIMRATVGDASSVLEVGRTPAIPVDTFEREPGFQRPLLTETSLFFVRLDAGGTSAVVQLDHGQPPSSATVLPGLDGILFQLHDASSDRLALTGYTNGDGAVPLDVWTYDVSSHVARRITDSLLSEGALAIDGSRIVWRDRSTQDATIYLGDLSETRWLSHGEQLKAIPRVGEGWTTWLDTRHVPDVVLYSFDHATGAEAPVVTLDPATIGEDTITLSGGRAVLFQDVGGFYELFVVDLATGAGTPLSDDDVATAGEMVDDMSDDGTRYAYARNGTISVGSWSGASPSLGAPFTAWVAPPGLIDIQEIEIEGSFLGWVTETNTGNGLYCSDTSGAPPEIVRLERGGGAVRARMLTFGRVNGAVWAAWFDNDYGDADGTAPPIVTCQLQCTGGLFCAAGTEVKIRPGTSTLSQPSMSATGMLAWERQAANGSGKDIEVLDLVNRRRFRVDIARLPAANRYSPRLSAGRLVFSSTQLNATDIWEMTIER